MIRLMTGLVLAAIAGCASQPVADRCAGVLPGHLDAAINEVEDRLEGGCEYHFDSYFQSLLGIAAENPDRDNPRRFSDHLMNAQAAGVISTRQARALYNRYFSVKFVSFAGDYNTCSEACPVRGAMLTSMRDELADKELGLLRISADQPGYYRADHLLKEADLVLEATCRACAAGTAGRGVGTPEAFAGSNR